MFRFIGRVAAALIAEWRSFLDESFTWEDPKSQYQNELRRMYGRGEISRARFLDLRARLDRDQIGLGDIQIAHQEALRRLRLEPLADAGPHNREVRRSLDRLYLDLGLVEEARAELARSQAGLEEELARVRTQIAAARGAAQAALPDEARARAALLTWQRLSGAAQNSTARRAALQLELERMGDLETELRGAVSRLKLLDSAERLAEVRLQVRQDLFAQPQKR
jgi:multidrug resistance efflux pump